MSMTLEQRFVARGLKMTSPRRIILSVLEASDDHPDAMAVHDRARQTDPEIAMATVYRTLNLLEDLGLIERHDFGDGRARYEDASKDHHDHLINVETGDIVEFHNAALETLKSEIADRLGFDLVDHRLELYGKPKRS